MSRAGLKVLPRFMLLAWVACLTAGCGPKPSVPDAGTLSRYPLVPTGGGPVLRDAKLTSLTLGPENGMGHHDFARWLAEGPWLISLCACPGPDPMDGGTGGGGTAGGRGGGGGGRGGGAGGGNGGSVMPRLDGGWCESCPARGCATTRATTTWRCSTAAGRGCGG